MTFLHFNLNHFITSLRKNPLFAGTIILTASGMLSRMIGFYYRIFLSRTIGADDVGIYQLIFPISGFFFALCCGSIQTGISRFVAEAKDDATASRHFYCGLFLSLGLSGVCSLLLYQFATPIATSFLLEASCAPLLHILSISFVFSALHACCNGYYYGKKKSLVPAGLQILEQSVRVISSMLFVQIALERDIALSSSIAVGGLLCGEIAAGLISLLLFPTMLHRRFSMTALQSLLSFCIPLTSQRVVTTLFGSVEAILLPACLQRYGYSTTDAFETFGVLMGMAVPLLFFPTAMIHSLSVLLMPHIANCKKNGNHIGISNAFHKCTALALTIGFAYSLFLFLGAHWIGTVIFHNTLVVGYIRTLSFLCPFLFYSGLLSSILHGLGQTICTFVVSLLCCGIRIVVAVTLVSSLGMTPYLYSMLASQVIQVGAYLNRIRKILEA